MLLTGELRCGFNMCCFFFFYFGDSHRHSPQFLKVRNKLLHFIILISLLASMWRSPAAQSPIGLTDYAPFAVGEKGWWWRWNTFWGLTPQPKTNFARWWVIWELCDNIFLRLNIMSITLNCNQYWVNYLQLEEREVFKFRWILWCPYCHCICDIYHCKYVFGNAALHPLRFHKWNNT